METLFLIGVIVLVSVWLVDRYRQAQEAKRQDEIRRPEEAVNLEKRRMEAVQDQLVLPMYQGEQALEDGDFLLAARCFQDVLRQNPPSGRITEWPHITEEMRIREGGLFRPKPHPPTLPDTYLGLGLAAMGAANIASARDYIARSGYYRLLPSNREERGALFTCTRRV